jgi:hypothetical protein
MYDCQEAQRSEMDFEVGVFEDSAQKTTETTRVSVYVTTNNHSGVCRRRLDGGMYDCQVVQRPKVLICWWIMHNVITYSTSMSDAASKFDHLCGFDCVL